MRFVLVIIGLLLFGCDSQQPKPSEPDLFVAILGIAQDAGAPQIGCQKACCKELWGHPENYQKVISLGIIDRELGQVWLLDATPDFKDQLDQLLAYLPGSDINALQGIFLTHAHIGHYTGLMDLGREAMGAKTVPVYAMPKMRDYLSSNGPWSQLVDLKNIKMQTLQADSTIQLSANLSITPFLVPHRDEYSETVGYKVAAKQKSFIFIPDIDKWHKWERSIVEEVENTDYAFLDAAFYSDDELPNRNMSEIPHPFVPETIELFKDLDPVIKQRIIFIHLNHTNPLLRNSSEYNNVLKLGFRVGREYSTYKLN